MIQVWIISASIGRLYGPAADLHHDLFIEDMTRSHVTRRTRTCAMTHSLLLTCTMTHSFRHDSLICNITHLHMCHDSFTGGTGLLLTYAITVFYLCDIRLFLCDMRLFLWDIRLFLSDVCLFCVSLLSDVGLFCGCLFE